MKMKINSDVGELTGNDARLMPYLDYCSIASGGHIGNIETITTCINLAEGNDVQIGAHPSYPDKDNFGRKSMVIKDVQDHLKRQLDNFFDLSMKLGVAVHHIKPHGALYHDILNDEETAHTFLSIADVYPFDNYLFSRSLKKKYPTEKHCIEEGFADRTYEDDLSLTPRSVDGALIQERSIFLQHIQDILNKQRVTSRGGKQIPIQFETLCVHGDHPMSVLFVELLRKTIDA